MWKKISRFVWRSFLTTVLMLIPGAIFMGVAALEGACIDVGAGLVCAAWLVDAVELGVLPVIALAILTVLIRGFIRRRRAAATHS